MNNAVFSKTDNGEYKNTFLLSSGKFDMKKMFILQDRNFKSPKYIILIVCN